MSNIYDKTKSQKANNNTKIVGKTIDSLITKLIYQKMKCNMKVRKENSNSYTKFIESCSCY